MAEGPNANFATVGHVRIRAWVTWPTFNFFDPLQILRTAIVIESNAYSVCGAFDAAFALACCSNCRTLAAPIGQMDLRVVGP